VRKLFDDARVHKRSVIFIDEIDAIGASRSLGYGDHSERTNTLNELLNQMDGFVEKPGLLVIAATNRVDILDEALLRPGRFDRLIKLDLPDCAVRRAILERYCACVPFAGTHVCLDEVAQQSEGLSGAELKNIVDEAAIYAARENAESVDDAHIRKAHAKVLARPRRGRGR
jgi:cell division protease FtsH